MVPDHDNIIISFFAFVNNHYTKHVTQSTLLNDLGGDVCRVTENGI